MINDDLAMDYDEIFSIIKVYHLIILITVQTFIISISILLIILQQISAPVRRGHFWIDRVINLVLQIEKKIL
jgi:hypothetical protein